MDFPKSVEGIGLVGNRFVNENPATGQIGSLIASEWCNALTDEMIAVIKQAGFSPSESNNNQLRDALNKMFVRYDAKQVISDKTQVQANLDIQSATELQTALKELITEFGGDVPV